MKHKYIVTLGTIFALTLLCMAPLRNASAALFRVGTGTGYTHATLAAAVAAADSSSGLDTILLTRSITYTQQAIVINSSVTLTGGFATCASPADSTYTTLNGAGGAAAPVLRINAGTGVVVQLQKLTITGGDSPGTARGGGVLFVGDGVLTINDSTITSNTAGFGGGIAALGTGDLAELNIGANVSIALNTARYNGGGLHLENLETAIRDDGTGIFSNEASGVGADGGYGGGIAVRSCDRPSILYLGSPGISGFGVVFDNTARYGGGILVEGGDGCDDDVARLEMYSTNAARLTKISGNTATVAGGGIYLSPSTGIAGFTFGVAALASLSNASLENNTSPQGSAVWNRGPDTGLYDNTLSFNNGDSTDSGVIPCSAMLGKSCGVIRGHRGAGRMIGGGNGASKVVVNRMLLTDNQGSELIRQETAEIRNSQITANQTTAALFYTQNMNMRDCTIAGNTVGAGYVFSANASEVNRLIVWQPGKAVRENRGSLIGSYVLANEVASVSSTSNSVARDPRFVDPANGDFSLTPGSPAVDVAPAGVGVDVLGYARDIDLTLVPNGLGTRDLGALERRAVDPIVQNGNFDVDLRNWTALGFGTATWDGAQNGAGASGSGSMHLTQANATAGMVIRPLAHCIHVPGPGTYALNALARVALAVTPAQRDRVRIQWQFRRGVFGNESCAIAGVSPDRVGVLNLPIGFTLAPAASPALIEVASTEWTSYSTILLIPEAEESDGAAGSSISAWVDGITLSIGQAVALFQDGFE